MDLITAYHRWLTLIYVTATKAELNEREKTPTANKDKTAASWKPELRGFR